MCNLRVPKVGSAGWRRGRHGQVRRPRCEDVRNGDETEWNQMRRAGRETPIFTRICAGYVLPNGLGVRLRWSQDVWEILGVNDAGTMLSRDQVHADDQVDQH